MMTTRASAALRRARLAIGALGAASCLAGNAAPAGVAGAADSQVATAADAPRGLDGHRVETLIAPSYFHGVHGIAVAPNGDVYAGDILGQTLWRIPAASRRPQPFVPAPRGMADDVAIDRDGRLVWTAILDGILYEQRPGGTPRPLATGLPGINSVGFGPDGSLYASQLEGANRLYEIRAGAAPRLLLENNGGLNGFQVDARGLIWAPQGALQRVVTLDPATLRIDVRATGFTWPTGVKLDSRGRPYVVDLTAGTLSRLGPAGRVERVAQFLPGIDNLAIDRDDRILVSSPGDNTLFRVDPRTARVEPWIEGRLSVPGGVTIDAGGRVLVADVFGFKAIDPASGAIRELGRRVGAPIVVGMNVRHCEGRTTLSHWYESTVRVLDASGLVTELLVGGLAKPQDAVALSDGSLLIAEAGRHRLVRVAPGSSTPEPFVEGFDAPTGLSCAASGIVYVTDAGAGTVSALDLAARRVRVVRRALARPEGIALGADGDLLVVETGAKRLLRLAPDGTTRQVLATLPATLEPPTGMAAPWVATGVALARDGRVFIASPSTTGLYVIRPPATAGLPR